MTEAESKPSLAGRSAGSSGAAQRAVSAKPRHGVQDGNAADGRATGLIGLSEPRLSCSRPSSSTPPESVP